MKRVLLFCAILLLGCAAAQAEPTGWEGVESALGRKGTAQGDMLKVTFPRSDLSVKVGGAAIEPGLALTSWIGFRRMGTGAVMMGDLVLLEREVAPVTAKLVAGGVKLTALHNHLIGSLPVVMYLHFSGEGSPEKLANGLKAALGRINLAK